VSRAVTGVTRLAREGPNLLTPTHYLTASAQTALFCIFNELYGASPKRGEWLGYISSVASLGRCVGPLWAVALYDVAYEPEQGSGDMRRGGGGGGDQGSGVFAAPAAAEAAALPIWLVNGGGTLLGAALVLAAWKTLELQPVAVP
jgi:hypothetical protein